MPRGNVWTNADGLVVGFGRRTVERNVGQQVVTAGAVQQIVINIQGTTLLDADVARQLDHAASIPLDALITRADLFVTTAFTSGGSAVLDIGVYNASTGAAVDDDGIDAAIAVATLVDNFDVVCDGALVGTVLAQDSKIGVTFDTAAFTGGEATLVIEYIPKM